jgi:hypothetical protein
MPTENFKLIQNGTPLCDVVEILDENNCLIPFASVTSLNTGGKYFLMTRIAPTLEQNQHAIRNIQTGYERKIAIEWTHGLSNDMESSEFKFLS